MTTRFVMVMVVVSATFANNSECMAAKADWGGAGGVGVIGFALAELTPTKDGGKDKATTFTFNYDVPAPYSLNAPSGQIFVLRSSAFAKYNNIPKTEFLVHTIGESKTPEKGLHVSAIVTVDAPGLYVVVYGPYQGLLTFDDAKVRETYKISGIAPEGAEIRWIDQDAGDVTIGNVRKDAQSQPEQVMRIRMVRAGLRPLSNKSNFKIEPFKLNKKAAERASLLQANW